MSNGVGRIRKKLAKMLSEATGKTFLPEKIYPATGWYRTNTSWHNDSYRWSAVPEEKATRMLDSYDRMTDCVRRGIVISDDEVFAKEPS